MSEVRWTAALAVGVLTTVAVWAGEARGELLRGEKPWVKIVVLSEGPGGGAVLTAAISRIQAAKGLARVVRLDEIRNPEIESVGGISIAVGQVRYETAARRYQQLGFGDHADCVKSLITGLAAADIAIAFVSAAAAPTPQTDSLIHLASRVGLDHLVVFVENDGESPSAEQETRIERWIEGLQSAGAFSSREVPVVWGSAAEALEGEPEEASSRPIDELLAVLDHSIPEPKISRPPFLMPVQDAFSITGRGMVVTGRIDRGVVRPGDEVELVGLRRTSRTAVTGVEISRKVVDEAGPGDNVALWLRDTKKSEVEPGQVLAAPDSIRPHSRFRAEVFLLTSAEGGRHGPISSGHRPMFYFRATEVAGTVGLPSAEERAAPGDQVSLTVELSAPIALEPGVRFAIREGGRTIGAGCVTETLE